MKTAPGFEQQRRFKVSDFPYGLAVGAAVVIAVVVVMVLFLEPVVGLMFGCLIGGVAVTTVLAICVILFRDRFLSKISGTIKISLGDIAHSVQGLFSNIGTGRPVAEDVSKFTSGATALFTWYLTRRALLSLLLWLVAAMVASLTSVVMMNQTVVLKAQTKLLERQNAILAGEGKWEMNWNAHYAVTPQLQIEAVIASVTPSQTVSGVVLRRDPFIYKEPQESDFLNFVKNSAGEESAVSLGIRATRGRLPKVDVRALDKLTLSTLVGWDADYSTSKSRIVSKMQFEDSHVTLSECEDCSFVLSNVSGIGDEFITLSRCSGDASVISGATVFLKYCQMNSVVIEPRDHLALNGSFGEVAVHCGRSCRIGVGTGSHIGTLVLIREAGDTRNVLNVVPRSIFSGRVNAMYVVVDTSGPPYPIDWTQTATIRSALQAPL